MVLEPNAPSTFRRAFVVHVLLLSLDLFGVQSIDPIAHVVVVLCVFFVFVSVYFLISTRTPWKCTACFGGAHD